MVARKSNFYLRPSVAPLDNSAKSSILYLRPIGLKILLIKQTNQSVQRINIKRMPNERSSNKSYARDYLGRPNRRNANRQDHKRYSVSESVAIRRATTAAHS